ncbi:MAG: hypothetical protein H7067_04790 [Burkholderiales bacterium]|nr:hypothetical protein [Opitutaceae bacterium]
MKPLFCRTAALVAFAFASVAPSAFAAPDSPPVNVTVRADAEALARGFEDAFASIPNSPVFITYAREDKGFVTLSGIRSVKAHGGVLVIRTDRGPTLVLPARSIVIITDERPATP